MAERSIAAVLKTVIQKCIGGSNPSVSAESNSKGLLFICKIRSGEMPEWSNGAVSKTVERFRVPRVRIPFSPLDDAI